MLKFQRAKIPSMVPKNYKSNFVSEKIKLILPELVARNNKLTDRLKSKLKVSNFLNNTESRNQKYLKIFLSSSDKRVKDIKTGLELNKAVKQSTKNLSDLCDKINNDVILQNSDFLIEEKKLLNENTEQETHMKINSLILNMRNIIKKIKATQRVEETTQIKNISKSYIDSINNILKSKLEKENNIVNDKINSYKCKLKNSIKEKKDFKSFADNLNIDNLKLLNYQKPKPIPKVDRECSNMARLKNNLNPISNRSSKNIKKKLFNTIRKNYASNISFNESGKSQIIEKDSFCTLKGLASNSHNLSLKIDKTVHKVNSLLDINLPNPSSYNLLLEKNRLEQLRRKNSDLKKKRNIYNESELERIINDEKELDKQLVNKFKLEKIINSFKNEIEKVKNNQFSYEEAKKNDKLGGIKNKVHKPFFVGYNKITKKSENSNYLEQTTGIFSKIVKRLSKSNKRKKDDESSLFNNSSNNYESLSTREYKINKSFFEGKFKNKYN